MFAVEERDRVRERLLELAVADSAVVGAAITGSHAVGGGDRWSDVDVALAIHGRLSVALERWTGWLYGDYAALHHWDLSSGSSVYRVFLRTWTADHPQHRPDPVGYIPVDLHRTVLVDDRDLRT